MRISKITLGQQIIIFLLKNTAHLLIFLCSFFAHFIHIIKSEISSVIVSQVYTLLFVFLLLSAEKQGRPTMSPLVG